jgi:hypothetical protein
MRKELLHGFLSLSRIVLPLKQSAGQRHFSLIFNGLPYHSELDAAPL